MPPPASAAVRDLERFGYSSSSESDEPPPSKNKANNHNQKKKKKKRKPPQQSINKIWKRFASKEFSKALSILPFDPVAPPSIPERPNELLSAGYERARDECSRTVKKIIQECRRVNLRYRDPGFDLDWDLRTHQGNCLNHLGSDKFDLSEGRWSTLTTVPKSVKRVHEIFEKPTFMKTVDGGDVKQGALGNCWLIASFSALANVEDGLKRICVEYDTRIGIYGFVFYRDGEWIYSIIDDKLYLTSPDWDSPSMQRDLLNQIDRESPEKVYRKTYQTGSKALFFGQCKDERETWVALMEKAYAKAHGDFASLIGGWIGEGLEDLSGGVTTELLVSDILDLDGFWENEISKVNEEFLFGCSTGLLGHGYGNRNGIREGHAYVVMDARTLKTGERLVKLRNPWGKTRKGVWEGPWSDGSKEWNSAVKEELGHQFGNDSVFWITFEDMIEKYQHIDRTRLFRDPDWRCCQRWIGVEVPWKPQWNEKFHFQLTKESPLVLVLQQLDDRYYKGLLGQYYFRLHFRVHEQGRPDSEDYIVRSHGNYLMARSVSIELPCMDPGNYSVFISVVGIRETTRPSIEEVVKRECSNREENEKLAQVGYAYDLAHSKGVAHLEHVAELRKKSDHKKASSSRMKERRKMWEKRHLTRDITRKQAKKNQEKNRERQDRRAAKTKAARAKAKEAAEKEADEKPVVEQARTEADKKGDEEEKVKPRPRENQSKEDAAEDLEETSKNGIKEEVSEPKNKDDDTEAPKDAAKLIDKRESGKDQNGQTNVKQAGNAPSSDITTAPSHSSEGESSDASQSSIKQAVEGKKFTRNRTASWVSPRGQPSPPRSGTAARQHQVGPPVYDSDCDSSDSPIEDWELLYSSDDMSKKPRIMAYAPGPPSALYHGGGGGAAAAADGRAGESDDDGGESGMPEPWNAICIVGFRVYSRDEDLDLRVVVGGGGGGGALADGGGMGEKGPADIDNAQVNAAGGGRGHRGAAEEEVDEEEEEEEEGVTDEVEIVDGRAVVNKKITVDRDGGDDDGDGKGQGADVPREDEEDEESKAVGDTKEDGEEKKDGENGHDEKKKEGEIEDGAMKRDGDDNKDDDGNIADSEPEEEEEEEEENANEDGKDDSADAAKSDTSETTDSTDSTPIHTPDSTADCHPQSSPKPAV
ncbi:hypothetical protein GGR56DRAFT_671298 [Xylariaceae sp. FL0804]|nr:hypothetical protein GGR56DRAFT_671298 [Xylariaceae sp. FL0804]